jgi:hypothetical protein
LKWFCWNKQGRLASENFTTKIKEYFDKYEAIQYFEQYFHSKTGNKWGERAYF